jgi:hypothetical protein
MDWRDLIHLSRTFRLPQLAEITGIPQYRILQWQKIGAWPVEPLGRGRVRKYDICDAIRAVIIREFADVGLPISGKGQDLTSALVGVVIYAARSGPGDLSNLPEQVKLHRDAEGEWWIDVFGAMAVDDERLGSIVVLIRLRRIAVEVGARAEVAIGT